METTILLEAALLVALEQDGVPLSRRAAILRACIKGRPLHRLMKWARTRSYDATENAIYGWAAFRSGKSRRYSVAIAIRRIPADKLLDELGEL